MGGWRRIFKIFNLDQDIFILISCRNIVCKRGFKFKLMLVY